MAIDPERPIEKLLRACARKRREESGAPLHMHPAIRRLLQGEVARQFGKKTPPQASPGLRLGRWIPRLAWGVAAAAALVLVLVLVLPSHFRTEPAVFLAKNQTTLEEKAPPPPAAPTAAIPIRAAAENEKEAANRALAERVTLADKMTPEARDQEQDKKLKSSDLAATRSDIPAERQYALNGAAAKDEALQTLAREKAAVMTGTVLNIRPTSLAENSVAPPADAPALGGAFQPNVPQPGSSSGEVKVAQAPANGPSDRLGLKTEPSFASANTFADAARTQTSPQLLQRFVQKDADSKLLRARVSSPPDSVLVAFQVEQSGSRLRIIDNDGSVYTGSLQLPEPLVRQLAVEAPAVQVPALGAAVKRTEALAPATTGISTSSLYFFRVTGTNRSLNQEVVFSGNVLPETNAVSLGSSGGGLGGGVVQPTSAAESRLPLSNSRISGTAVIGNQRGIQINAVATKP